jgi:hypothetical protein
MLSYGKNGNGYGQRATPTRPRLGSICDHGTGRATTWSVKYVAADCGRTIGTGNGSGERSTERWPEPSSKEYGMMRIQVKPSILGDVYRFKYTTTDPNFDGPVTCDTSILFSGRPLLVWGSSLTPIDSPSRFGPYGTRKERMAFCRAFATPQ